MNEPKAEEFGRTKESFKKFESVFVWINIIVGFISFVVGISLLLIFYKSSSLNIFVIIFICYIASAILFMVISAPIKSLVKMLPISQQYDQYQISLKKYDEWKSEQEKIRQKEEQKSIYNELEKKRRQESHWKSLSGIEFEKELSILYKKHGYDVFLTPTIGDHGVDIVLTKEGEKIIVQCKAHKNPVGVAAARELYGSLSHFKSDKAILASVSGFTSGVKEFVRNKPMELISLDQIIKMQNTSQHDQAAQESNFLDLE